MGLRITTIALSALLLCEPVWPAPVESSGPGAALQHYLASPAPELRWPAERLDIYASLPKLGEHGYLRAVRRMSPSGKPVYQILSIEGNRTVRNQVIARYLAAEAKSASLPSSSIAITPANYRFRYRRSVQSGGLRAYVFEIVPKKKRLGLIRGEVWINAAGFAVRQAGRLVHDSSIFVRHIQLVRDTDLRCGAPFERVTHVEVDTRVVGKAELTITERPYAAGQQDPMAADPPPGAHVQHGGAPAVGVDIPQSGHPAEPGGLAGRFLDRLWKLAMWVARPVENATRQAAASVHLPQAASGTLPIDSQTCSATP